MAYTACLPAVYAQINFSYQHVDSLKAALVNATHDTTRVLTMARLSEGYRWSNSDSAMQYGLDALALAQKTGFAKGEASAFISLSVVHRELGDLPKALDYAMKGLKISTENHLPEQETFALLRVANVYVASKNSRKALFYLRQVEIKSGETNMPLNKSIAQWLQADLYVQMNEFDSARYYIQLAQKERITNISSAFHYNIIGDLELKLKNVAAAISNYKAGLQEAVAMKDHRTAANLNNSIAAFYKKKGERDSAIYYAKQGLAVAQLLSYKNRIMTSSSILAELYDSISPAEALRYHKIYAAARDSLFSVQKMQAVQGMLLDEQERMNEVERSRQAYENQLRLYILLAGLAVFLVIIFIQFRNNKQKQRANRLLNEQKAEIDRQKKQVEQSFSELKTTQAQLIQSEKMASLGELTAGIAHEIQNPLNFVNNFSEVSNELIGEMVDEVEKGNTDEVKSIAKDVQQNLEKILHHGKRADTIVKGMLLHSRISSGQKEPTDINALADEYLRLAYHGLRAKDKSFNATLKTDYDESIGKINIIPQDMGRVILNLITNAFYVVDEKKRSGIENYEPTVSISTKKINGNVEIKVKDNGNGIPKNILDKVFQPFFTTKPTGQGTGLGLSLSYDIVKAHGGELKVETKEGQGSEFTINLHV
jgi:two-component system, NtrC family, sensor kinase